MMKKHFRLAFTAMIIILIIAIIPMVGHATAGDPSIKISQDPQGTWVIEVNVEGTFTLVVNGSQVSTTSPALAQAVAPPSGGQLAFGSCLVNGQQFDLVWDPGSKRLFMDPWIAQARQAIQSSSIPCHVKALATGNVEALGQKIPLGAGQDWFYTFPVADPSLGFAFQAN